ncbi:MAG: SctD/MshK family protein [Planctomycetota bacterium]
MNTISLPKIPQKLAVSGIVYNEKSPSAIISKQVYGVGDIVDGYIISRITRTQVEFEKNGEKLVRQTR